MGLIFVLLVIWFFITFLYIWFWNIGTRINEKTKFNLSQFWPEAQRIVQALGGTILAFGGLGIIINKIVLTDSQLSGLTVLALGIAILSFVASDYGLKKVLMRIEEQKKK